MTTDKCKEYEELLFDRYKRGIISWNDFVSQREEMQKRQEILEEHKKHHSISHNSQGWVTRVEDSTCPKGLRLLKKVNLEDLEDAIVRFYKEAACNPTVDDIFEEWISTKREGRSPSYITRLRKTQKSFFKEFGKRKIKSITEDDIYNFLNKAVAGGITNNSLKKIEGNLNGIFKKARRMRLCDIDLSIVYENIREDTPKSSFKPTQKDLETSRDKALSFKECEMLRTFANDSTKLVDKALALMTYLPDRLGEITDIRKGDISKDFAFIDIHATEIRYKDEESGKDVCEVRERTKSQASMRMVPVPTEARTLLKEILLMSNPDSEWLFSDKEHERYTNAKLYRRMGTVCKQLGIMTSLGKPKCPHKLRHTYANRLSTVMDVPDKTKAALMGHSEYDMTKYYQCDMLDDSEKLDIVNAMFG